MYWELLKWFLGMSNHTFIGITTALVEKWGIEHGCEHHRYLISQCHQLYEELQVRNNFVFVKYLHIGSSSSDLLTHLLPVSRLPDKLPAQQFFLLTLLFTTKHVNFNFKKTIKDSFTKFIQDTKHTV